MGIGHQLIALAPDDGRDLGMGLVVDEAIDDMGARAFQPSRLADIRGLVKARLQFHQRGHRLAAFGRVAERGDDRAVVRGAVKRLLDRQHVRVRRRLVEKADDHVEGLIRVVEQHVLLADRREHVAVMVLHTLRHAGREGGPLQVAAAVQHQFLQIGDADHALDLNHLIGADAKFLHDQRAQAFGRAGGDLHADHLTPAAAFQRGLEFAHKVLGLVLDLDVAVAQDAEGAMAGVAIAGEERAEMKKQQFLKRKKALAAGQGDETGDLLRDRQKRLQPAPVAAFQFQRKTEAGVGDEGEGVGRVDSQRREDRENLAHEIVRQEFLIPFRQLGAGQKGDARAFQFPLQLVPDGLLHLHQAARVGVDALELFGGRQTVIGTDGGPLARQLAQARDADGVEFIEVGGRDRQESHPLQKRDTGIARLIQNPPVKGQPAEFTVEKAVRAGPVQFRQRRRGREGGLEEICLCHRMLATLSHAPRGVWPIMARPCRRCREAWRRGCC